MTRSTAFVATLTREMGERIDPDKVCLDLARYAQPDTQRPSSRGLFWKRSIPHTENT